MTNGPISPEGLPSEFPISVIITREPVDERWRSERWQVLGVVAGQQFATKGIERRVIRSGPDGEQYLWTGFSLRLDKHETEGYYRNISADKPCVFVICRHEEGDKGLVPFLVSVNYYDAAVYMDAGDEVFNAPIPPEVYRWVEYFVLEHHEPERKKPKRTKTPERDKGGVDD